MAKLIPKLYLLSLYLFHLLQSFKTLLLNLAWRKKPGHHYSLKIHFLLQYAIKTLQMSSNYNKKVVMFITTEPLNFTHLLTMGFKTVIDKRCNGQILKTKLVNHVCTSMFKICFQWYSVFLL